MAASYNGVPVPANGARITYSNGHLSGPRQSDHAFYRRRRHGARHLEGFGAGVRCGGGEGLQRQAAIVWYEVFAGREGHGEVQDLAAGRQRGRHSRISRGHQGAADHAGRRRHSIAQRGPAADSRFVLLRASGEVLQGHSFAGEASRAHGRRDLSRKYGRRLCRHRVGAGNARGGAADRVPEQGHAEGRQETGAPGFGRWHQADFDYRHQAPGADGDQVCAGERTQERDPGAQGQHPEVYRRRVPQMGIRTGDRRVPRPGRHRARELDSRQQG